jgi:hypothetical protein
MFAKRHRRPQEEQPLVPHGLVWQAMQETASTEKEKSEVEQASSPAKPLQIVPPPVPVSRASAASTPASCEPASRGLPLFWRKLAKLEIVKPVSRGDDSTIPAEGLDRAVAAGEHGREERPFPEVDPIKHETNSPKAAMRGFATLWRGLSAQRQGKALILNFRKFNRMLGQRGVAVVGKARAKMLKRAPWGECKRRIGWGCDFIVARVRNAIATAEHGGRELTAEAQARFAARLSRMQRYTGAAQSPVRTADAHPVARRNAVARIFVGLPLQPRSAFVRLFSQMKVHTLRRDSRLWTSVAMAGLSAALAFGFISTVRHYATQALPSHLLNIDSSADSSPARKPAEATGLVQQKSGSRVGSVPQRSAIISRKRVNAARVVKPKPRHREDDDYVARDTYVSYGNRRNGSR